MSIFDDPDAHTVTYRYSGRPEPGLYPGPPAAVQAKALPLGKGTLIAVRSLRQQSVRPPERPGTASSQ